MSKKSHVAAGTGGAVLGVGAIIALILGEVVSVEGGYVNNPNDPGGETNRGITKKVARQYGYKGSMRQLTEEIALDIYRRQYVEGPNFDEIIKLDPKVAHEIIDTGVNAGPNRAARWFQMALNQFNNRQRDYRDIAVDGQIGPGTVAAFRSLQRRRGKTIACQIMLNALDGYQAAHYTRLAKGNSKFETFQVGWFRTRIRNVDCA